ncbi:hypothetical protein NTHI1209_00673 [Haemophilus influenzae]|uniref:Uncharacterized protein n=1 Tax=Haemophilus influenzae TaxID=727 RepID=A0A158SW26_HAEIF|nr:hypothetical protein NTHI1209_00673 [Haemophilus influenzae]
MQYGGNFCIIARNRIAISMETFSVSRNGVWFTRSGLEGSSQSRNYCVPRRSWEGFRPTSFSHTRSINLLKKPFSLVIKLL